MLRNHLKTAWRGILRHRTFSFVNILGLAVSLTAFFLMALYIEHEQSFDSFHAKADRIYRVADDKQTENIILHNATAAAPVAPALKAEFPEVLETVRLKPAEALVAYGDKRFEERNLLYADASLFQVFSFKMLQGNAATALKNPNSVVVTQSAAAKYFRNADPLGAGISFDGKSMKVTGVVQDIPSNSHISFDFLLSMATAEQPGSGLDFLFSDWYSDAFHTYILLPQGYDARKLSARLEAFDKRHQVAQDNTKHHFQLEKLTDIYLRSDREDEIGKTGSLTNVYVFSAVAIFILLIACFNFINLSTARAAERAKEVAVKKVVGAGRSHMIGQFFTESFLMTGIAAALAVLAVQLLLPVFNAFSGRQILVDLFSPFHVAALFSIIVFVSLLSGTYPAFVLSAFKPAVALKGQGGGSDWGNRFRKALVIFQFAISVVLIVCSTVVYTQLQYMQNHDLGFEPTQTLIINFEGDRQVQQQYKGLKQALLNIAGVQGVAASSNIPGDRNTSTWSMNVVAEQGDTVRTELPIYLADFNFLEQYEVPIVAGRALTERFAADSTESMLINQAAVKQLGFENATEAIGLSVGMYPNDAKIVGVFKDFHYKSLQQIIEPLTIRVFPNKYRVLSIRLHTQHLQQTISAIEKVWKQWAPQRPLEYSFLDESFNRQYEAELKFGQVFGVFSALAIFIACLGLFGLALFSVQQRTKEIGIRKVLGASVSNIVQLLSKDFIKLVLVAAVAAFPVAWYAMHTWLEDFAYRIGIPWWVFFAAGIVAIAIAFITISFQAMKAAIANPVKSLRTE
jgi:putative ABC transport system permease protein